MINYKYKESFEQTSIEKQLHITYDNVDIDNEYILSESLQLTESLCSQPQLQFGACEASTLKITLLNTALPLIGKKITVWVTLDGNNDEPFMLGVYTVKSDSPTADRKHREIIAYDAMYDIINTNVADWYNQLTFPMTLKAFRESFLSYLGITQLPADLPNDAITVEETIQPSELSGGTALTAICEINGCFGHIRRDGTFEYRFLPEIIVGLYPANDLYPQDSLYPRQSSSQLISGSTYTRCQYEDYTCQRIGKLQIRQEESDIGAIAGTGDNCYIIEDNFLIYGKSAEELKTIAENVFGIIKKVRYRPFEAEAKGNPCIEVGDAVRFNTTSAVIESYVLQRTLKGIQALKDSYTAEGKETYAEKVNSVNKQIIQLRGKTNTLTRTVEETRLEIKDIEKGLSTRILQTAGLIETEVNRATSAEGELSSRITQTADSITAEVTRAMAAEGSLSSKITMTEQSIATEVKRATDAETSLSSQISQTAESITSEVTRAQGVESALSSRINQTAESIELKVSKGHVSSQLSLEGEQITIKSNRFVLEATNCSITKEGNITANNVDLTGKITADSGLIGGFTIEKGKGLRYGKLSINDGATGVYIGPDGIAVGYGGMTSSAFKVTASGDVEIGNQGGVTIKSQQALSFQYATAYINHLSTQAIKFSSSRVDIMALKSILGKTGGTVGFYGAEGAVRISISKISTPSTATVSTTAEKINEILTALKKYNLIE